MDTFVTLGKKNWIYYDDELGKKGNLRIEFEKSKPFFFWLNFFWKKLKFSGVENLGYNIVWDCNEIRYYSL